MLLHITAARPDKVILVMSNKSLIILGKQLTYQVWDHHTHPWREDNMFFLNNASTINFATFRPLTIYNFLLRSLYARSPLNSPASRTVHTNIIQLKTLPWISTTVMEEVYCSLLILLTIASQLQSLAGADVFLHSRAGCKSVTSGTSLSAGVNIDWILLNQHCNNDFGAVSSIIW
jgi:hypothetical protein